MPTRPRSRPARPVVALLALTLALALAVGHAQEEDAPRTVVRMLLGNTGSEALHRAVADEFMAEHPDIVIEIREGPEQTDDFLNLVLEQFAFGRSSFDVFQLDVTWPAFLADFLIDLRPHGADEIADAHIPSIIENNTVEGRLLAVPWFTDAGILYYRTDLLDKYGYDGPPATWDELEEMARTIQEGERAEEGDDDFWGFVWQGGAYEGLTVDALEWVASHGGGTILAEDGAVTIDNPQAVAALERAADWVGTITLPGVIGFNEEDARNLWQSGNAAFMRNWPYAFALSNGAGSPIAGKVGIARLPAGPDGRSSAVLGGWSLGVSRFSEHPEAAAMVALHFASEAAQRRRSVEGAYAPTLVALYDDPDVLAANPFYDLLEGVLAEAVVRPSRQAGDAYFELSRAFYDVVHDVLKGTAEPDAALEVLALDLEELLEPAPTP